MPSADVGVRKLARLHADRDLPERGWQASWLVTYGNRGDQTAQNVSVIDTPSSNQSLTLVRSALPVTLTREGDSYAFPVGDLSSLQGGAIMLRTAISFSAPAGTVLINAVRITATNDVNSANNLTVVTLTLPSSAAHHYLSGFGRSVYWHDHNHGQGARQRAGEHLRWRCAHRRDHCGYQRRLVIWREPRRRLPPNSR